MKTCPRCEGRRSEIVFDEQIKPNRRDAYIRHYPCALCRGAGEITEQRAELIAAGRELRVARRARGATLLDEARRLGVSLRELAAREHGHASPG